MEKIKLVELFSGIGSQSKALKNKGINYELVATCEWDIHSMVAYDLIHNDNTIPLDVLKKSKLEILDLLNQYNLSGNGKEKINSNSLKSLPITVLQRILAAIIKTKNYVDITQLKGCDLPADIGLLTYSFPCQDLSNVGCFHGYKKGIERNSGSRSSLLWEVERLLYERKKDKLNLPKFLMLENVPALLSKKNKKNFDEWKNELVELGYTNMIYTLRAPDFGLPQTRCRVIMISVLTGHDLQKETFVKNYFEKHNLNDTEYIKKLKIEKKQLSELLRLSTEQKYWNEALQMQPRDTKSRRDIWLNNPQLTQDMSGKISLENVATLTTKQDRHPNSGNIYFDYKNNTKSKFRYLTPRECFLLMGFDEQDFDNVIDNNMESRKGSKFFSNDVLVKLAGNSIPVNILEQVFIQINYLFKKV